MLDPKFIKEHINEVRLAAKNKRVAFDADGFLDLHDKRLTHLQHTENLRQARNKGSDQVKKAKTKEERDALIANMKALGSQLEEAESALRSLDEHYEACLLTVPSIPSLDTPVGNSDADNVELYKVGKPKDSLLTPKTHLELGESLGLFDFARGAKVAGSRSYYLVGLGADLERALHNFALDLLKDRNYTQMSVPVLVRSSAMEGTGYLPGGADQAYFVEKDDAWLVGTSEVPLASFYADETLSVDTLPVRLCAWSTCFRREAGAAGRDTKGLYRVHQFQKIEQVVFCAPDKTESDRMHNELLKNSEDLLQLLELPYRVVQVCTGDLGQGQVKKHDIETWMPSRNAYGETHSCSSFYDFQCRRLKVKTKNDQGQSVFCYSLNNTALATPRILIPLLENHQTADGRIYVPKALRPYLRGQEFLG